MGGEQKEEFTESTLKMILCGSTQRSEGTVELHNFFFFFSFYLFLQFCSDVHNEQLLPSLSNFHKSSSPLQSGSGGEDKCEVLL